jgi:outer membrane protein assembly factor BamB
MQIDPALRGKMPRVEEPISFLSKDGRIRGWKITLPGRRPLATPAVVGGRAFLGGGFGSYEFYALDADTGRVSWQYQTTDDGPTAAVVHNGFVAFNTESCELEVLTTGGRPLWKKWLGDPLLSMPALDDDRAYVAYPDSRGDRRHYLAAFDLRTGRQQWRQPLDGEVITAPVLADGHIYLTTLAGILCCFRKDDGTPAWQEAKHATTSPVVWRGRCYFSQRKERDLRGRGAGLQQMEEVAARGIDPLASTHSYPGTACLADWLDYLKRQAGSPQYQACEAADAAVGFTGLKKGDAKMAQAQANLGHGHVSGLWAYQGSKPFLSGGRLFSSLGDTLHCIDPETEAIDWQRPLYDRKGRAELLDNALTPPVLVNRKVFLGTIDGEVICLSAASGERLWTVRLGEPVLFQPAVARGRVYVPTHAGSLFCLETGDPQDDGWLMWGASAAHNGLSE